MLRVDDKKVFVSRGDTGYLTVRFDGVIPSDGTQALVTLKENPNKLPVLWEKQLLVQGGQLLIRLTTAETNFTPDRYFWDVRLFLGGEIVTPVEPQDFVILEVVGNV